MKKISFIIFVLSFAIIFSSASAKAQNVGRVDVKIPFDFGFGAKTYAAGSYKLRVTDHLSGSARISLLDEAGNELESIFSLPLTEQTKGDADLTFDGSNGVQSIKGIVLNHIAYTVQISRSKQPMVVRTQRKSKTNQTS
jgi:hypothetical protein